MKLFVIFISAMLVNNYVLSKFLGICSFLGVSKKRDAAVGMGLAVTFVMIIASIGSFAVHKFILKPFNLEYLNTIAFILVIAALVQFVEMVIKKFSPGLYKALGIYLPLITTNCAVLGSALINIEKGYNFIEAVVFGFSASVGFTLAIVLFSGVRERLEFSDIPESFKGFPIALVAASLLSMAFMGFQGLKLPL